MPDGSAINMSDCDADVRHCVRHVPMSQGELGRPDESFEFADVPANVSGLTIEILPSGHRAIALTGQHERIA